MVFIMQLKYLPSLMRVRQYIKNFFIFLPAFFAGSMSPALVLKNLTVFTGFSLVASSIYIVNDLFDIETDLMHPQKQFRPLPSGKVHKRFAVFLSLLLCLLGMGLVAFISPGCLTLVMTYFALNLLYCMKLKHVALVDIFVIALGFVIRLFVGAGASQVSLSMWIVIMTFLLALFLALAKRRDDLLVLQETGKKVRRVVDGYNLAFVNSSMIIMASVVIVSYIMYTTTETVQIRLDSEYVYLTAVFVIFGIVRYLQLTLVYEDSGSPTKIVFKDLFLQLTLIGWVGSFSWLIYF